VLDDVPGLGPEREGKHRWNVPNDQRSSGGEPTDSGTHKRAAEIVNGGPLEKRAQKALNEIAWQAVEESEHGRAEEEQGRGESHKEQVLNHVDGEELLVEKRERRAEGKPNQGKAAEKAAGAP